MWPVDSALPRAMPAVEPGDSRRLQEEGCGLITVFLFLMSGIKMRLRWQDANMLPL